MTKIIHQTCSWCNNVKTAHVYSGVTQLALRLEALLCSAAHVVLQAEHLVPADSNGLALSRTPAEILALVFLGSPNTPGGFFPNGLNGAVGSESNVISVAVHLCVVS